MRLMYGLTDGEMRHSRGLTKPLYIISILKVNVCAAHQTKPHQNYPTAQSSASPYTNIEPGRQTASPHSTAVIHQPRPGYLPRCASLSLSPVPSQEHVTVTMKGFDGVNFPSQYRTCMKVAEQWPAAHPPRNGCASPALVDRKTDLPTCQLTPHANTSQ